LVGGKRWSTVGPMEENPQTSGEVGEKRAGGGVLGKEGNGRSDEADTKRLPVRDGGEKKRNKGGKEGKRRGHMEGVGPRKATVPERNT